MDDYVSKPIQGKRVTEMLRLLFPAASQSPPLKASELDEAVLLERVGGDATALREIKDLCIDETPRLLEKTARAVREGHAEALAEAAHTLRGMCLVFTPNDVVRIAAEVEDLARAGDLTAAAAAHDGLRAAAEHLITALGGQEHQPLVHL